MDYHIQVEKNVNPYPTRIGEHLMQTKQGLGRCPYLANLSMYIHCLMWPGAKGLTWIA